jgi:hypothetical protein
MAGLTLVYCIWRDRSLFSYDALEATRACSQILTIFGEKWPGAIKYRDIFDALSGSLFKLTIAPGPIITHAKDSLPLQLDVAVESPVNDRALHNQKASDTMQNVKSSMSHMVTDAVKEAFMEVDEEAPGGWQGWRMWNDMVRDKVASGSDPAVRQDGLGLGLPGMSWDPYNSSGSCGIDPVQDAAMHMGYYGTMDETQWSFGGYR